MSEPLALYEVRSPAALITLNRPDKRNALSRGLIDALDNAVAQAESDRAVRCVILTGAGPVFCAGMDLAELEASLEQPVEQSPVWDDALRLARLYDRIYQLPKPTIAAVNGPAVAGGAGLVTVCDLALAASEARFGYPEVRRGLVAAMVMPHLLRHVGERAARYMLLTGELLSAELACRAGLVNAVVPGPSLLETAHEWARHVAEAGPEALARTKELLRLFSREALSVEEAARASAAPRLTDECRQGLEAFFAKRPAPWAPR
jgi:methylglutaconyl-CoA hydratase